MAGENTPLLSNPKSTQEEQDAYTAASASAFDPNASAFTVPVVENDQTAVPEGILVTEAPLRSDLFIILGGMWIGTFLAALDSTIVATTLSVIGSEFEVSNSIVWLGTSYLISQTAFQPLYGRFSDIFGRRPATLFASAVFLIGSLACGLSKTYPQLIVARFFAGIGGGGLTTMSSIVTSDLVSLRQRGTYQGLGNVVFAFGAAIGGPLGGYLGDNIGWRYGFLIQVPICVLHFTVVALKVNIPSGPGDIMTKIKRIDIFGSLSLVGAVSLTLLGLSLGGNQKPWSDPLVWGSVLAGIFGLVLFVLVEIYVAKEPLLSPKILFSRTPGLVSLTNWFISMSQFALIYNIPLYFSAVEQTTTSYAGLHLIPNAVFASTASLLGGLYMSHTGRYKTMLICFGVCAVTGPISMLFWARGSTPEWLYWIDLIPAGIGYGGILTVTLVALISAVEPKDMAASTGVSYLFRATGSLLGISLSGAILQNSLANQLPKVITGKHSHKIISMIRQDVSYIKTLPLEVQELARDVYAKSLHHVFYFMVGTALCAFICLSGIREYNLPGRLDRK